MGEPNLATTSQYRALSGDDDTDNYSVRAELELASSEFRARTGQTISRVDNDEVVLNAEGGHVLFLPQVPVIDVTSVEIDGEAIGEDDFEWSADGVLEITSRTLPVKRRAVTVTYSHGHDEIPGDVVRAVCDLAARGLVTPGATSESEGVDDYRHSVTYGDTTNLPGSTESVIARYRL